jgi:hypothetical protein
MAIKSRPLFDTTSFLAKVGEGRSGIASAPGGPGGPGPGGPCGPGGPLAPAGPGAPGDPATPAGPPTPGGPAGPGGPGTGGGMEKLSLATSQMIRARIAINNSRIRICISPNLGRSRRSPKCNRRQFILRHPPVQLSHRCFRCPDVYAGPRIDSARFRQSHSRSGSPAENRRSEAASA